MVDATLAEEADSRAVELDEHVEPFLERLRAAGYATRTLIKKRTILWAFGRWVRHEQVGLLDLTEEQIDRFSKRPERPSKARSGFELGVLRSFLADLRGHAGVPPAPIGAVSSPGQALERGYVDYIRNERGLSPRSVSVYLPFVRDFLGDLVAKTGAADPKALDAKFVRCFLLDRAQVHHRSLETVRLLATALRSLLRFLFLRGLTTIDLSRSVTTVRTWRQSTLPASLAPEEVERILAVPDRSTPNGRRDFAILLLLARLGLRAGEVATLELGDIQWRAGEIVVRAKGRTINRLPLVAEVGEALAAHLQGDRDRGGSRRVFLRKHAPRIGLTGPASVGHVVRAGFRAAGIRPSRRGAAHLFRHSLATRMIRQGASMAEISDFLGHRSMSTTAIYAKVDVETLRAVARRWPGSGGER